LKNFLIDKIGIDSAIIWTLLDNSWKVLRGPLALYFIVQYLNPTEQGLWYSFISLGALTMLAELGFTYIITQFVSHEFAYLRYKSGFILGRRFYRDRLISLIRYSLLYYLLALPVAAIVLLIVGSFVYKEYSINILIAWYAFTFVSSVNLYTVLIQSVYQGLNQVSLVKRNIFFGTIVNTLATWGLLMTGIGLWALVGASLICNIVVLSMLYKETKRFWWQLFKHKLYTQNTWFHDLISLQWRYGVTWISGYFLFYFMVPSTLYFLGPVAAGQLGISQAIFGSVAGIAGAWSQTKVPLFNILVASHKRSELDALMTKIQWQTFWINIFANISALIIIIFIFPIFAWEDRALKIDHLLLLALITIPNILISNWGYYLRAHKVEPYMFMSIFNGLSVGIAVWITLSYYESLSMLLYIYCGLQWFMIIPAKIIFNNFRSSNAKIY
jgi:hypothetical protein